MSEQIAKELSALRVEVQSLRETLFCHDCPPRTFSPNARCDVTNAEHNEIFSRLTAVEERLDELNYVHMSDAHIEIFAKAVHGNAFTVTEWDRNSIRRGFEAIDKVRFIHE